MQPAGVPEPITIDRSAVGRCFGCGQANHEGLRMTFSRYSDGTIESRHRTAPHHCGVDTVVHGGIQATLLDEVLGVAAQLGLADGADPMPCVTAECSSTNSSSGSHLTSPVSRFSSLTLPHQAHIGSSWRMARISCIALRSSR